MALEHDRLSGIVGVAAPEGAAAAAASRRARTKISGMHHHAIFTKDVAATRHFYEDLLELKMVLTLVDEGDIAPKSPSPFLHMFFEMGDGSMLAFFAIVPIQENKDYKWPELSIFDHHLSVRIPDRETQLYFKARLEAAGYKVFEMDHGFCISIYVDDPNGIHMELSYDTEEYEDHFLRAEQVSQSQLRAWLENRAKAKAPAELVSETTG